jgi:hypothetical protein
MDRIKKTIGLLFLFSIGFVDSGAAQTMILEVSRSADTIPTKRGPNLQKFSHGYINFGFIAGADEPGAKIIYGPSVEFGAGARKKYKISPLFSLGWELGANEKIFKLKQENGKSTPDSAINDVERMDYTSAYISFYNRINFDTHRGNYMGTFLDLGINGEWDFSISHIIKNTLPDGSKITSQITGLPFVNNINYQVFARLGKSHLSWYVAYRLSKLFKPIYHDPELPALSTGIDLGIFSN